jgi:hypothetical protein
MRFFKVAVFGVRGAYPVEARSIETAIAIAKKAARRDGVADPSIRYVRDEGKVVR